MKAERDSRLLAWLAVGFGELLGGLAAALGMLLVPAFYPSLAAQAAIVASAGVVVLALIAAVSTVWLLWRA